MTASKRPSRRAPSAHADWFPLVGVVIVSLLFGIFVLPRFGKGLERHPAPDFALPVLSGGEPGARVRLADQRGKLVILDFWASWCGPCKAQTQALIALKKRPEAADVVVIGINVSDDREAALRYLSAVNPPWLVVEDPEGVANRAYGVEALPTLVAIDKAGNVFAVRRRFVPESELSGLVAALSSS